jgi:hypothetical protein
MTQHLSTNKYTNLDANLVHFKLDKVWKLEESFTL